MARLTVCVTVLLLVISGPGCSEDPERTKRDGGPATDAAATGAASGSNADRGDGQAGSHFDPWASPVLKAGGQGATVDSNRSEWQKDSFRHDVSPVDLSSPDDKPAGKHGFLVRKGETLEFEDGTPARFWGGNVTAHAIFRPRREIEAQGDAPSSDRHAAAMFMAAVGGLQGWDAPMIFNYSQTGFTAPTEVRRWSTFADPGLQAAMPAAALAFRQGQLQPLVPAEMTRGAARALPGLGDARYQHLSSLGHGAPGSERPGTGGRI